MDKNQQRRIIVLNITICIVFAVLLGRLFLLQVVRGDSLADVSADNSIRVITSAAPRGEIYTSDGLILADSEVVFVVSVASSQIKDKQQLAEALAAVLADEEITAEVILAKLEANARQYESTVIKRYNYAEGLRVVSRLEERREKLPGVIIIEEAKRIYPQATMAGHILGTVGAISKDEYAEKQSEGYLITDWLGKSGLEKTMEKLSLSGNSYGLRGEAGIEQVEVTATANAVRTVYEQAPVPGNNLVLTLDASVQQVMEQSLAEIITDHAAKNPKCDAGAAVLLNVKTGAIIAMASYPTMNPNDFEDGLSTELAEYYWDISLSPTLNRAISAAYPPGSTFKPITALAALVSGVSVDDKVLCSPSVWGGSTGRARCTDTHGYVSLYTAMARSCNSYFQEMGYRAGIEKINRVAKDLGLGSLTGVELPGEISGLVPDQEWKAANFSGWEAKWHDYDTFYTSIGQGYTTVTPLQLASYVATIANNGTRMKPYLVDCITDVDGTVLHRFAPQVSDKLDMDSQLLECIREGMRGVAVKGGTAYGVFADMGIAVAAKTGTAQTGLIGDDSNDTHAVFVAFAPYEDPEVAFSCVIEYGKSGSSTAAYVCKDVFNAYFNDKK